MLFVLNKDLEATGVIKNYWNDSYSEALEDNFSVFQFDTTDTTKLEEENYIVYPHKNAKHQLFIIKKIKDNGQFFTVESEHASTGELLDAWVLPTSTLNSYTVEAALNYILANSDWEAGDIDFAGVADFEWEDFVTAKEALNELASVFDVELEFEVEFNGTNVKRKLIHVRTQRGTDTKIPLEVSKEVSGITKELNTNDLVTAVYVRGKDGLTLAGYNPSSNKPRFENFGSHIIDNEAYQLWNNNGKHKFGVFQYDTKDQTELWARAVEYLKENSTPKYVYEVEVVYIDKLQDVSLGDTIVIKDFYFRKDEPLLLEARVVKVELSKTDPASNKLTLGDYKRLQFSTSPNIDKLQKSIQEQEEKLTQIQQEGIFQGDQPPEAPLVNQLWLDTSIEPNMLKRWTGVEWIKIADDGKKALEALGLIEATQEEIVEVIERFDNLDSTNIITPVEKTLLLRQWKTIQNTYAIKRAEAVIYNIDVSNLDSAYNNLSSALGPILADTLTNSEANFEDITNLLSAYNGMEVRIQDTINFVLNQNIAGVKSTAETVRDNFNAFNEQYGLSQEILDQQIDDFETDIGTITGQIGTIHTDLGTMTTRFTGIDGAIASIEGDIGGVTTRLTDAEGNISSITTSVSGLATRVTDVEGDVSEVAQTASGLATRVSDTEGNISTLTQTAAGLRTDVNKKVDSTIYNTYVSQTATAIQSKAEKSYVDEITGDITADLSTLTVSYNGIEGRVSDAEGNISTLTQTSNGFATRISDTEGNVSSLTQTVGGYGTRISSAEGNISAFTQTLSGFQTRVSDVEGDVSTLTQTSSSFGTRITNNEGNISSVSQLANALKLQVEDPDTGLAALNITAQGIQTQVSETVTATGEQLGTLSEALDTKATNEELGAVSQELATTAEALRVETERLTTIEQSATDVTTTVSTLQTTVNDNAEVVSSIETYMNFSEDGLQIGKSDSDMNVNISNTEIQFLDNGAPVAYINGQKMYITQTEVLESMIIGNHKFDKGATSTTITWIG